MSTATATRPACLRCGRTNVGLHARSLCARCYKYHRAEFPRARSYRPYTARERAFIRANWKKLGAKEVAAQLGRGVHDLYAAARRFGAAEPRRSPRTTARIRERMTRLHAQGLSDREIARRIGFGHGTVIRWLRRLGLPSNCRAKNTDAFPERFRQKQREVAIRRAEEEGADFAYGFMASRLEGRIEAVRMGWPQAETLFEARILECLYRHGDSTTAQLVADLAADFGLDPSASWTGRVVRVLKKRGLTAVLYRVAGHECAYGLARGLTKTWETKE